MTHILAHLPTPCSKNSCPTQWRVHGSMYTAPCLCDTGHPGLRRVPTELSWLPETHTAQTEHKQWDSPLEGLVLGSSTSSWIAGQREKTGEGVSLRRLEGSGGHSHRHVWGLEVKGKSYTKTFRERLARLPQVRAPE